MPLATYKPVVSQLLLEGSRYDGMWFVYRQRPSPSRLFPYTELLHDDLQWHPTMRNEKGRMCYFGTRQEAEALKKKWEEKQ